MLYYIGILPLKFAIDNVHSGSIYNFNLKYVIYT